MVFCPTELLFAGAGLYPHPHPGASTPYSAERLNHASRYFAAVGLIIGLICGGTLWIFLTMLLPSSSAIVISMVFGLLLTGAFHEDGLADMCDGLGGGLDGERKLVIMKDSRIGSYGAITLIMALLLKFTLLQGSPGRGLAPPCWRCWSCTHYPGRFRDR